jgi:epoxyqueuosine reductase
LTRHLEKRRDPALLADRTHGPFETMVVLAVNYHQFDLPSDILDDPSRGIIASYAWGDDYHEIIRPLLYELDAFIRHQTGRTTQGKCLVDTGPILERDWAARAGIGFTGKNCCIIHPTDGSWLLLATLLIPEKLRYDPRAALPQYARPRRGYGRPAA